MVSGSRKGSNPPTINTFPFRNAVIVCKKRGELITGPDEIQYEIPALDAGEYYFLCIVHPTMNGTVVVA